LSLSGFRFIWAAKNLAYHIRAMISAIRDAVPVLETHKGVLSEGEWKRRGRSLS